MNLAQKFDTTKIYIINNCTHIVPHNANMQNKYIAVAAWDVTDIAGASAWTSAFVTVVFQSFSNALQACGLSDTLLLLFKAIIADR
ncbi:MAG: hypothetical protein HN350_12920 [Phycisphaerales bacterium]|jgi:hypothetical protein|nr:hypothetical protein [Phycisphaerales bacterium]